MNTSKIIKSLVEDNAEELALSVQECLEEKTKEALVKTYQEVSESILTTTEIDEDNSFVLPDGERIEINPDIANFLSETHDSLPKDLQKSFRESIFDSKDKFIQIMESLIEDQEGEDQ